MLAELFIAAAVLAPTGWYHEPRIERVASMVAGKPVAVLCPDSQQSFNRDPFVLSYPDEVAGFAVVGGNSMNLAPWVCARLASADVMPPDNGAAMTITLDASTGQASTEEWGTGAAALVVAHEASHLAGLEDEAATERRGYAYLPAMLAALDVPTGDQMSYALSEAAQNASLYLDSPIGG